MFGLSWKLLTEGCRPRKCREGITQEASGLRPLGPGWYGSGNSQAPSMSPGAWQQRGRKPIFLTVRCSVMHGGPESWRDPWAPQPLDGIPARMSELCLTPSAQVTGKAETPWEGRWTWPGQEGGALVMGLVPL